MALKQIESLRKLTKDVSILLLKFQLICLFELKWSIQVQDLRKTNKEEQVKKALQEYDESLEKYYYKLYLFEYFKYFELNSNQILKGTFRF